MQLRLQRGVSPQLMTSDLPRKKVSSLSTQPGSTQVNAGESSKETDLKENNRYQVLTILLENKYSPLINNTCCT